jgi:hypothetical protein
LGGYLQKGDAVTKQQMPTSKIRILIFPGEAENAFELFRALRFATRFEVWGASSRPGYGNLLFPRYRDDLPVLHAPDFLPAFNRFLEEEDILLVFPTHDDVALFLAEQGAALKATVVGSGQQCALLCREKKSLYAAFSKESFCPQTYDRPEDVDHFPVFVKPSRGQGGIGGVLAADVQTLRAAYAATVAPVVCEFLPGEELTVDCFSDRHGELLFVGPRSREVVRMGISFVSRPLPVEVAIQDMAEALHRRLKPRGLWFFQAKRSTDGTWKLLEASCRAAGTMSVYRQLGVNLPLLAAYDALNMDVRILTNAFKVTMRRRLHSSYVVEHAFKTVYVDYDDTVIINDQVNCQLIQFLYQCRNQKKRLVLLSRHPGNLEQHMRNYCVFPELFDEIHHLRTGERKSNFVTCEDAIFIDNLFTEREDVLLRRGVPVFDVDAVESLL